MDQTEEKTETKPTLRPGKDRGSRMIAGKRDPKPDANGCGATEPESCAKGVR